MKDLLKSTVLQVVLPRFRDRGIAHIDEDHGGDLLGIARIPAAYPNVGDVRIEILGEDEVLIEVGYMTHLHISADEGTPEQRSARIVEELVHFLDQLLADQVLLFPGGMTIIEKGELPDCPEGRSPFTWSGPYQGEVRKGPDYIGIALEMLKRG